jgi:hypothetical protein
MEIRVGIIGLEKVQETIRKLPREANEKLDNVVEKRVLLMVNETRNRAPKLTGKLANSIDIKQKFNLGRAYGSNVEYARRQEFEHKTLKGFFRKTVGKHRPLFFNDVNKFLNNWLGR